MEIFKNSQRLLSYKFSVTFKGGHRHRPSCRGYPTSNINISYSDIGTKYVGLNPLIPIPEEFKYRHQLPFRYRTKSISDIPISKIDRSFPNDPSKILSLIIFSHRFQTHNPSYQESGVLPLWYEGFQKLWSDIEYRTKVYSDIQYNVGLCALQSDIGRSDIRLSTISLITDTGLSAQLWSHYTIFSQTQTGVTVYLNRKT